MSKSNMIPLEEITFQDLPKRRLNRETCEKWSYGVATFKGQAVQVATYRNTNGTPTAQKVRFADKTFLILGEASKMGLYGAHLWRDGGKRVVVTEGEIDALSVSQMQQNKWPVVSVPNGAAAARKAVQESIEWLEKFEEVVFLFDQDEPGQKATAECVELLTPGKAKIAKIPLKDASDMVQARRLDELNNAIWGAKTFRPDGVLLGEELWDRLENRARVPSLPFPYVGLNIKTEGSRLGELILVTSGSGMGKTEIVGQWEYYWITQQKEKLGLIHLEERIERSTDRLMGLHLKKRLHLDAVRSQTTAEERRAAFEATVGSGLVRLYDHFGSTESKNLFAKIRYFAKGCGCTTIILDHISIVVSGMEDGDERRLIDNLMTRLATMAQELQVRIVLISHLRKADGTPHEEGGRISLDHLRGSGSLKQLSRTIIALERDQQDEERKHWTLIRVLKCTHTGDTGVAGWLRYDPETGWLHEDEPGFDAEGKTPFKNETTNEDF